jgi:hypothetical protein
VSEERVRSTEAIVAIIPNKRPPSGLFQSIGLLDRLRMIAAA